MKSLEQNFFYPKYIYSFDQINKYFVLNRLNCNAGEYLTIGELSFQWYTDNPKQKHFQRKSNLPVTIGYQKNSSLTSFDCEGFANSYASPAVICSELKKTAGLQTTREHLCLSKNPSTETSVINKCSKNSFFSDLWTQDPFLKLQNLKPRKFAKMGARREVED